ncbi:MAG: ribonuclease D [Candidatus Promineifilaceae bacterium]
MRPDSGMPSHDLPPYRLLTAAGDWQRCLAALQAQPRLALDLEANSLFAYREQVCLIQLSIPGQDYILDPVAGFDFHELGALMADPAVEKVFHAVEYDLILLRRSYGWRAENLFDTMWAARILGIQRYGLANLLEERYGVRLNKRYQKADWCRRPLEPAQLAYAQMDTHYLLRLRDDLGAELAAAGRLAEAEETFAQQADVRPAPAAFDPDGFWAINGVKELPRGRLGLLQALYLYRDRQAQALDRPAFKIFGDRTLLELAQAAPRNLAELGQVHGMSAGQLRRHGRRLLAVIQEGLNAAPPRRPRRAGRRTPDAVIERYERLREWRKRQAQARGVESDVIMSREALWELAHANPETPADFDQIASLGPWRRQQYQAALLKLLG